MANINGWGRGTWNEGAWGTALPVELSTVGVVTTSAIGSVIVHENEVINLTGQSVTSTLGSVTPRASAEVSIDGVSATFSTGFILVYGEIDTSQTPSYSEVATTQSPNYTTINAGRDAA